MTVEPTPRSYLEEKILGLKGVSRQKMPNGTVGFAVGDEELAHFVSEEVLKLKLSPACRQKIGGALKGEERATILGGGDTVELRFTDDIDVEFVFLYVRFAWKYR